MATTTVLTDAERNALADYEAGRSALLALYTADPGQGGTNEATGAPYARTAVSFSPAGTAGPLGASQPATVGIAWSPLVGIPAPAGTYTHLGLLGSDGTVRSVTKFDTAQVLTAQGTVDVSVGVTTSVASGTGGSTTPAGQLLADTFDRPDTALGVVGTASDGVHTWQAVGNLSTFGISSSRLIAVAQGGTRAYLSTDVGASSYTAEWVVVSPGDMGLIVRYVDPDNHFFAYSGGSWSIYRLQNGVQTEVFPTTRSSSAGDVVRLVVRPGSIQLLVNGIDAGTYTGSELNTATRVGFRGPGGGQYLIDSVTVTALTS